jgi:ABC-2 type transport system ATP-binding protein
LVASHDLAEIETFATHIAYLDQGRLRFVEPMEVLVERFRDIEVVLEEPAAVPAAVPSNWLNAEQESSVYTFTDSRYDPQRTASDIRQCFSGIREITVRTVPFRSIFLALAKSANENRVSR